MSLVEYRTLHQEESTQYNFRVTQGRKRVEIAYDNADCQ
jgi:hypothetical protein